MQKWEYLRIKFGRSKPRMSSQYTDFMATVENKELTLEQFDKHIQLLGEQGWELVSTTPVAFWSDVYGMTTTIHFIFKRPKE